MKIIASLIGALGAILYVGYFAYTVNELPLTVIVVFSLALMVYSIERIESLAQKARTNLYSQGYTNVMLVVGDGSRGLPAYAPYDKIIVTAAAPSVPQTLLDQLKEGGKMVIPVGGRSVQDLMLVEKALNGRIHRSKLCGCRFVPLIGEGSWND